jgi:hypothetical protein
MSDTQREYRTIKQALMQLYAGEPKGNIVRRLTTPKASRNNTRYAPHFLQRQMP